MKAKRGRGLRALPLVLALCVSLCACAPPATPSPSMDVGARPSATAALSPQEQAEALWAAGDTQGAIAAYEALIAMHADGSSTQGTVSPLVAFYNRLGQLWAEEGSLGAAAEAVARGLAATGGDVLRGAYYDYKWLQSGGSEGRDAYKALLETLAATGELHALLVDINLDGTPELFAGDGVYHINGGGAAEALAAAGELGWNKGLRLCADAESGQYTFLCSDSRETEQGALERTWLLRGGPRNEYVIEEALYLEQSGGEAPSYTARIGGESARYEEYGAAEEELATRFAREVYRPLEVSVSAGNIEGALALLYGDFEEYRSLFADAQRDGETPDNAENVLRAHLQQSLLPKYGFAATHRHVVEAEGDVKKEGPQGLIAAFTADLDGDGAQELCTGRIAYGPDEQGAPAIVFYLEFYGAAGSGAYKLPGATAGYFRGFYDYFVESFRLYRAQHEGREYVCMDGWGSYEESGLYNFVAYEVQGGEVVLAADMVYDVDLGAVAAYLPEGMREQYPPVPTGVSYLDTAYVQRGWTILAYDGDAPFVDRAVAAEAVLLQLGLRLGETEEVRAVLSDGKEPRVLAALRTQVAPDGETAWVTWSDGSDLRSLAK